MIDFNTSAQLNIERAVLSTYVYWDDFNKTKAPDLKKDLFLMPFHKRLAEVIQEEITANRTISIKIFQIEEKIKHPNAQEDWLNILVTNPLPPFMLKDYVEVLTLKKIEREIA